MGGAPDYGPGDWVVCIKNAGEAGSAEKYLRLGWKYLVKEVVPLLIGYGVRLFSVPDVIPEDSAMWWSVSWFRKLDPATDVPVMTKTSVPEVQS